MNSRLVCFGIWSPWLQHMEGQTELGERNCLRTLEQDRRGRGSQDPSSEGDGGRGEENAALKGTRGPSAYTEAIYTLDKRINSKESRPDGEGCGGAAGKAPRVAAKPNSRPQ